MVGDLASLDGNKKSDSTGGDETNITGRVVRKHDGSLSLAVVMRNEDGKAQFIDAKAHSLSPVAEKKNHGDDRHALIGGFTVSHQRVVGTVFHYFILALILLNVATIVADSIEAVQKASAVKHALDIFEAVSVAIFTIEYLLRFFVVGVDARFVCCGRREKKSTFSPCTRMQWGRLRWFFTFYALIDIASIVPFYINVAVTGSIASTSVIFFFYQKTSISHEI